MITSPSLEQAHLVIADRLAEAQHAALVQQATTAPARPSRSHAALRMRLATALRSLACRLDSSPALNA